MLIKWIWRNSTLLGKQRGKRSAVASEPASVELVEADVLGAALDELVAPCSVMESSVYIRGKSHT